MVGCKTKDELGAGRLLSWRRSDIRGPTSQAADPCKCCDGGVMLEGNITEHSMVERPTFESDSMATKLYSPTPPGEEGRAQPGKYG